MNRLCPWCGSANPEGSLYCGRCGGRIPGPREPPRTLGQYSPLRLQVDPGLEPPPRDVRWVLIMIGVAAVFLAAMFLIVGSLLTQVTSTPNGGCSQGSVPCAGLNVGPGFTWAGVVLLVAGAAAIVYGVVRALR
jgi:hypothetical protein